jgi:hypothetical protein
LCSGYDRGEEQRIDLKFLQAWHLVIDVTKKRFSGEQDGWDFTAVAFASFPFPFRL